MLALDPDQLDALLRLDRRRFAQALAALLPEAWPTVAARVGERATDFVAAALDAADREGLGDSRLLAAALLNLWCLWGPGFESRPGFEWARALLDARERSPELRMVQLVEQTRERLRGPAPAAPVPAAAGATLAQFDAGLQRLVAAAQEAALRGVFVPRPEPATLPAPCDLRELELAVTPAEGRQEYRRGDDGVWRLQPVPPRAATLRIEARPASALALAALSAPARAGAHARLRLRLQPGALCDPTRHPAVTIDGPQGRLGWRGRDAAALALALEGPALPAAPDASIGLVEPLRQRIAVETCGIRAAGEPIGVLSAEVVIHPSAQHLLESR
ncbi:MAG TPA: hypothetical protein VF291_14010, partial [Burkholderiaceae bacterium]